VISGAIGDRVVLRVTRVRVTLIIVPGISARASFPLPGRITLADSFALND
jgi:hypothetical protein